MVNLPCSDRLSASLAFYPPGTRQSQHAHDYTQVSFLLSGEMLERHRGIDWTPPGFGVGVKPAGLVHENAWGPSGVLIFSAKLLGNFARELAATEPGWSGRTFEPSVAALVSACLRASTGERREEVLLDLLALQGEPLRRGLEPPPALEQARQAIMEEPHSVRIAEAAELAGMHRVRFSLLFKEHYGLAPSLYRLRALTARAVQHIAAGTGAMAEVAHDVGFSDQAHMTRSVKRATGLTPGRLRSLFA